MISIFAWSAVLSLAILLLILCSIMLQLRDKPASIPPLWSRGRAVGPTPEEMARAEEVARGLYRVVRPQERPAQPERIIIGGKPERLKEPQKLPEPGDFNE